MWHWLIIGSLTLLYRLFTFYFLHLWHWTLPLLELFSFVLFDHFVWSHKPLASLVLVPERAWFIVLKLFCWLSFFITLPFEIRLTVSFGNPIIPHSLHLFCKNGCPSAMSALFLFYPALSHNKSASIALSYFRCWFSGKVSAKCCAHFHQRVCLPEIIMLWHYNLCICYSQHIFRIKIFLSWDWLFIKKNLCELLPVKIWIAAAIIHFHGCMLGISKSIICNIRYFLPFMNEDSVTFQSFVQVVMLFISFAIQIWYGYRWEVMAHGHWYIAWIKRIFDFDWRSLAFWWWAFTQIVILFVIALWHPP